MSLRKSPFYTFFLLNYIYIHFISPISKSLICPSLFFTTVILSSNDILLSSITCDVVSIRIQIIWGFTAVDNICLLRKTNLKMIKIL